MVYLPRALEDRVLDASEQFPVLLLTGPRQVGKTTLLRHLCSPERHYVTLDDPGRRALANEDPALFLQRFPPPVLIDEIQYAPDLLPHIKMEVDASRSPGAFWLTGSQQFHAMQGITESLAGRVALIRLLGLSAREADRRPSRVEPFLPTPEILEDRLETRATTDLQAVFRRIWTGSFPALVAGPVEDRDLFYGSYLQTYVARDVRDLAEVSNQQAFLRFLRAAAARTGQLLNLSDLARDVDVSVPTAKRWLSILEASFVVHLLRPYHGNVGKRLVKTPKLYFLDTGLCAHLTDWSTAETLASGAMAGPILETWVVAEVLKSHWHRLRTPHVYFYRDRDGREIDLLLEKDGALYPVEIKLAATPRREWVRTFAALEGLGPRTGAGAVVCLTPESLPLSREITAVPVGAL
jgi:predicted AAA+ superfamily ATPase